MLPSGRYARPSYDQFPRIDTRNDEGSHGICNPGALAALASPFRLSCCLFRFSAQAGRSADPILGLPFRAGGGHLLAARIVAQPLSELLVQPVVVANRVGSGARPRPNPWHAPLRMATTALMMSTRNASSAAVYRQLLTTLLPTSKWFDGWNRGLVPVDEPKLPGQGTSRSSSSRPMPIRATQLWQAGRGSHPALCRRIRSSSAGSTISMSRIDLAPLRSQGLIAGGAARLELVQTVHVADFKRAAARIA